MNRIAILLIRFYQIGPGRLIPGRCRYYPSCSYYARECFEEFGFFKALGKSVWRILRCNPMATGYFDPVHPDHQNCNH